MTNTLKNERTRLREEYADTQTENTRLREECSDIGEENIPVPDGLSLIRTEKGLTLTDGKLTLSGDFTELLPRLRKDRLSGELLIKACRIRNLNGPVTVVDATAGMGEDSLLLAEAGFWVLLFEKDPVIGALLSDTLLRSRDIPELSAAVGRMTLYREDSISAMRNMNGDDKAPDIIFLDPMFPGRTKSGKIGKKFQLLQRLECPCADEAELLAAAVSANPRKIVIKRPLKGPFLAGRKPDYSVSGKAVRYDVLVFAGRMPGNTPI